MGHIELTKKHVALYNKRKNVFLSKKKMFNFAGSNN